MHGSAPVRQKSLLRFFMGGSVDDGKSTLIGRLLHETGAVAEDELAALTRDSARFGNSGQAIDFALLVDGLEDEREQGITIDVAHRYFSSRRRGVHCRRYAGPRKLYPQYGKRRIERRSRHHSGRCAAGPAAADPAARDDRAHGRRSPLCTCGEQARPRELGPRGL